MPLTPADLDALTRVIDDRIKRALNPVEGRVKNHSMSLKAVREEEIPAARRSSQEFTEDRVDIIIGSQTLLRQDLEALHAKVNYLGSSIPPTATRTEGKADALIAGQEQTDKAIQKSSKKTSAGLVIQIVTILGVIAQVVERILHAGSP